MKKISQTLTTILLLCLSTAVLSAQTVRGKVTDDKGEALIGASVVVKGTTNGSVTDLDGNYSFDVSAGAVTLTASFLGYNPVDKTLTVAKGATAEANFTLSANANQLEEMVVVGYGQQKRGDLTGVVSSVNDKTFNRGPVLSAESLINGKVAGVQVTTNGGEPGGGVNIVIRGITSISAGGGPLYVIDGVPVSNDGNAGTRNPMNFLNASDIESVAILKDASAAAIYGARGANGVVIITTKKGKAGKLQITYDASVSASNVIQKVSVLTADEYKTVVKKVNEPRLALLGTANTDWQSEILRTGISTNHALSVGGGTGKHTYHASLGYSDMGGIIKGTRSTRTNANLSYGGSFLNDQLAVKASYKGGYTNDYYSGAGLGSAIALPATQPILSGTSAYGGYWEWENDLGTKNPVAQLNLQRDKGTAFRNVGNVELDYKLPYIKGLSAHLNLGGDRQTGGRQVLVPWALRSQKNDSGYVKNEDFLRRSEILETWLNYKNDFGGWAGKIDLTAGYAHQSFRGEFYGFSGRKFKGNWTELDQVGPLSDSLSLVREISDKWKAVAASRLISFFGRLNYNIQDRYLFTATLRRDGSSNFGPQNRWGLFPSGAAAWRVSNEPFMKPLQKYVSDLKLRASYGVTGNDKIGANLFRTVYIIGDNYSQYQLGNTFYTTVRPGAADRYIKWEETASTNYGVDFGFFGNRLNGSFDIYNRKTKDLLFYVNVPAGSNLTNRLLTNIGTLENAGYEFSLEAIPVARKGFNWSISGNFSYNKNQITFLDGNSTPGFQGYATGGISGGVGNQIQTLRVGSPFNSFLLYDHYYVNGKPVVDDPTKSNSENDKAMYRDANGDGKVDDKDKVVDYKPAPDYLFGLSTSLTYQNWDFNLSLRGNLGNYVYNNVASSTAFYDRINELVPANLTTGINQSGFTRPQYFSNYYLENGSFLRIDNIQIGYNLKDLVKKVNLRVYAVAQNPMLFTKYSGIDPEMSGGIDNNIYPRSRTFTLGVRANF
jgi:TonB-dependent starch-binding outer membrane protein SusC